MILQLHIMFFLLSVSFLKSEQIHNKHSRPSKKNLGSWETHLLDILTDMKANTGRVFPDLKDRSKTVNWYSNVQSIWNILMFLYISKENTMLGNTSKNSKRYHNGTKCYCIFIWLLWIRGLLDCKLCLSHHIRFEFKSDDKQRGLSAECQCLWKHHTDNHVDATEQRAAQTFKCRALPLANEVGGRCETVWLLNFL